MARLPRYSALRSDCRPYLDGVWQPGKKVLATIFAVCPLVALVFGLKYGRLPCLQYLQQTAGGRPRSGYSKGQGSRARQGRGGSEQASTFLSTAHGQQVGIGSG
jgi:hypothetical protein